MENENLNIDGKGLSLPEEVTPGQKIEVVNAEAGEPCVELYYKEGANTLGIKVRQKTMEETVSIFDSLYEKYGHLTGKPKEGKIKNESK